jgi:hypothetical protein
VFPSFGFFISFLFFLFLCLFPLRQPAVFKSRLSEAQSEFTPQALFELGF